MAKRIQEKSVSVEDRVIEIREDAAGMRLERLARGNLRITISAEEMRKRKEEHPERMVRLNKAFKKRNLMN